MLTRAQIKTWPKTDLHCHLDGSLRLSTLLELSKKYNTLADLPGQTEESLHEALCAIDESDSLADFLVWFKYTIAVLQTKEALERVTFELLEDAAAENVRYLEIRYAPVLSTSQGLSMDEVIDAMMAGIRRGEKAYPITARIIICSLRDRFESESFRQAELAVKYKNKGVVAFDLAGGEAGNPAKPHSYAFGYARENNLNLTCHAGEAWGPASIKQALHDCGVHRIGHGVTLLEDDDLLQFVVDHRVPLEICPTSNVQTHVVKSLQDHPIKTYLKRQVRVTVNTDNRLFSRTTVTDELWKLHQTFGYDEKTLKWIVLNGFKSAFLPYGERQALLREIIPALEMNMTLNSSVVNPLLV
jgi:adenosine deaminase